VTPLVPPDTTPEKYVRTAVATLRAHARKHAFDAARTIAAVRAAATLLLAPDELLSRQLRSQLQTCTGLSAPMVEWGIGTTLASLLHAPLEELVGGLPPAPQPGELIGVILAGNIFCAGLRALTLPLLAGAHVLAKAASGEGAFARAWHAALLAADGRVAARLEVLQFSRSDDTAARALCESVDALSVYGGDETVEQLGRALGPNARLIPHGHGVSVAYVTRHALSDLETAQEAAERVALDIAAYEQGGCLSPQFVCVDSGAEVTPERFSELLSHHALPKCAHMLPPAVPTLEERAARLQWQAVAAVRGKLYAHEAHAVSYEHALAARMSPGGRHVSVHACGDRSAFRELLEPFAKHLKCVGVAGPATERAAVAELLAGFSAATTCHAGEMQTPPFDAHADGRPPFAGLRPTA